MITTAAWAGPLEHSKHPLQLGFCELDWAIPFIMNFPIVTCLRKGGMRLRDILTGFSVRMPCCASFKTFLIEAILKLSIVMYTVSETGPCQQETKLKQGVWFAIAKQTSLRPGFLHGVKQMSVSSSAH